MPEQNNEFDILTINGYPFNTKDTAARNDIASIIGAIQVNNTSISGRINDLNERSFDSLIKISSNNDTEISNISDGLYKIQYVTVETIEEEEVETINNTAILIQKGTNQYLFKDGQLSSRIKTNDTWGEWQSQGISTMLSGNYEMSSDSNNDLTLEAGDTYEEAFAKIEKAIFDNEKVMAASLNNLNSKIPTVPTTSTSITENDTNPVSGGAVYSKFKDLIGTAPAALDTLGEITTALNNDANLATTLTNQISVKIPKVSNPTTDNFASFNSDGTIKDSGHSHSDYITSIKTVNNESLIGNGNIVISGLPQVSVSDNGKILMVVNGQWALVSPSVLYSGSGVPNNTNGNNGDLYMQTA